MIKSCNMKGTFFILFFLLINFLCFCQSPVDLANEQLDAYNKRDIEAFLRPYSDSVSVYNGKGQQLYKGKEIMRDRYGEMFKNTPNLNCTLVNRIAVNNTVIEHEEVTKGAGPKIYAIVMYKVLADKIQEVHFLDRIPER